MSGAYQTTKTSEAFKTSEVCLEHIAAELTEAAYPVMLRHGVMDNWLDVELELWKTMRERSRNGISNGFRPT